MVATTTLTTKPNCAAHPAGEGASIARHPRLVDPTQVHADLGDFATPPDWDGVPTVTSAYKHTLDFAVQGKHAPAQIKCLKCSGRAVYQRQETERFTRSYRCEACGHTINAGAVVMKLVKMTAAEIVALRTQSPPGCEAQSVDLLLSVMIERLTMLMDANAELDEMLEQGIRDRVVSGRVHTPVEPAEAAVA